MAKFQRWYDRVPELKEVFCVLEFLTGKDLERLSVVLYKAANEYRKDRDNKSGRVISLGRDKLFGYYQGYQSRRKCDRHPSLRSATSLMKTLQDNDLKQVVKAFHRRLEQEEVLHIYETQKAILKSSSQ